MNHKELYIQQLMIEKLSGLIDDDAAFYLDDLLEKHGEIRLQWEKMQESFKDGVLHRYMESLDEDKAWNQLKEVVASGKQTGTIRIRRLAIAASVILPLLIASIFLLQSKPVRPLAVVPGTDRNVKLYYNESQFIDLTNYSLPKGTSIANSVKLHVGNGTLDYVPLTNKASRTLNTLVIPETATYKLTLSDKTEVILNSMSQLTFPFVFSKNKREVWVSGEAYFKVAKNARRPFIVHTPQTDIEVIGTEFNVNTYDSLHVKTALVKGIVKTKAGGVHVQLKPGDLAVFTNGETFDIKAFDSNELSWMQGIYYFQKATLNEIANVVKRWYGDKLIFDDLAVSSSRFTGAMFKEEPLKDFLDNLSLTSNIRYNTDKGVIHLSTH